MSNYVPLCHAKGIGTIYTTKSFWDWFYQPTTVGQMSKIRYLIYNYNVTITVPSICGHTSRKISDIEKAIREGKVTPRKMKHGHIESAGKTYWFVPMQSNVKSK